MTDHTTPHRGTPPEVTLLRPADRPEDAEPERRILRALGVQFTEHPGPRTEVWIAGARFGGHREVAEGAANGELLDALRDFGVPIKPVIAYKPLP